MFIILPNTIDGLPALESKISETFFEEMEYGMRSAKLHVAIPKFKVEVDVKIKDVLMQMGMTDIFNEPVADLSGISGKKDLFVSKVFHKTFIEVNEEGSEAAAVTGMKKANLFCFEVRIGLSHEKCLKCMKDRDILRVPIPKILNC